MILKGKEPIRQKEKFENLLRSKIKQMISFEIICLLHRFELLQYFKQLFLIITGRILNYFIIQPMQCCFDFAAEVAELF